MQGPALVWCVLVCCMKMRRSSAGYMSLPVKYISLHRVPSGVVKVGLRDPLVIRDFSYCARMPCCAHAAKLWDREQTTDRTVSCRAAQK